MFVRNWKFNLIGVILVAFWIVMMGILIRKTTSMEQGPKEEGDSGSSTVIASAKREWKEIYLKDKKVGYSVNMIKPFEEGYFIQDELFLKLNLMGMGRGVYALTQSNVDQKFVLKNFFFKMSSGVVNTIISGKVEGNQILIKSGRGRRQRSQKIQLSEPPMITSGMGPMFKTMDLHVGDSFRLPFFDPSTMAQKAAVLRVAGRENLKINKIEYHAFRIQTEMWGKGMTFWIDENGEILKEEGFMGLKMIKSSPANAPLDIEGGGGEDFYEMAAVEVDRQLPRPGKLSTLRLKLKGIEDAGSMKQDWNSGRQRFRNGVLEIDREKEPFQATYTIPYNGPDDSLSPFLKAEFNIESDAEEIVEKAHDIAGNDNNPVSVSRKMLNWVYDNLEKRPVISVPSALEVLRTRVGDCNEHATLLTALLRAVGIPARLSVGLVYSRNRFFYHAWTEAFVGEWISMDATLKQMPADVSHIRLMHGNLEKQVEIIGLIGKLKIEVLDFGYD